MRLRIHRVLFTVDGLVTISLLVSAVPTPVKAVSVSGKRLSTWVSPDDEFEQNPLRNITGKNSPQRIPINKNPDLFIPFLETSDVTILEIPNQTRYLHLSPFKPGQTSDEPSKLDSNCRKSLNKPSPKSKKPKMDQIYLKKRLLLGKIIFLIIMVFVDLKSNFSLFPR